MSKEEKIEEDTWYLLTFATFLKWHHYIRFMSQDSSQHLTLSAKRLENAGEWMENLGSIPITDTVLHSGHQIFHSLLDSSIQGAMNPTTRDTTPALSSSRSRIAEYWTLVHVRLLLVWRYLNFKMINFLPPRLLIHKSGTGMR